MSPGKNTKVPPHPSYFGSGNVEPELRTFSAFVATMTDSSYSSESFPTLGRGNKKYNGIAVLP